MLTTNRLSWGELLAALWAKWEHLIECWGDGVRDCLLDLEARPVTALPPPPPPDLPAVAPERLLECMRCDADDTIRAVAELLNDTPPGRPLDEDQVCELFAELARRTVARGLALRVREGAAELPPLQGTHRSWADRYRRMILQRSLPAASPPPERFPDTP